MKINIIIGLLIVTMFNLSGCGGGSSGGSSSTSVTPTEPPAQKTSIIDGSWERISSSQTTNIPFNDFLNNDVQFNNGKIYTSSYLGTTSGSYSIKDGTFTLNENTLMYTLTSSSLGYFDHSLTISEILNKPPMSSTSTINQNVTCTVTLDNNLMTFKDNSGNINIFKKSGTTGTAYIPFIKSAAITPTKLTTSKTSTQISVTMLDSDANIDHVTLIFKSFFSSDTENETIIYQVPTQSAGASEVTVLIPFIYNSNFVPPLGGKSIEVTAFDKSGNKSNTKTFYYGVSWTN